MWWGKTGLLDEKKNLVFHLTMKQKVSMGWININVKGKTTKLKQL